jgi:hypothetical protein
LTLFFAVAISLNTFRTGLVVEGNSPNENGEESNLLSESRAKSCVIAMKRTNEKSICVPENQKQI